jgi:arsenic resistance protein ArsH
MSLEKTPNIATEALDRPTMEKLDLPPGLNHPPRILILYGSLRPQSFSRKLALEAERVLQQFGAETRVFDPHDLPVLDSVPASHPKVQELRALSLWSEGQVWVSPERHGTVTGVFMNQIDWLPLEEGSVRPTQAARWPSCRYAAARNHSTWSTRCASWGAGCAWSRSPTSPRYRRRGRNSMIRAA